MIKENKEPVVWVDWVVLCKENRQIPIDLVTGEYYPTREFDEGGYIITGEYKPKLCNRCEKKEVVGRQQFCKKCIKIRQREQKRDYARKRKKIE